MPYLYNTHPTPNGSAKLNFWLPFIWSKISDFSNHLALWVHRCHETDTLVILPNRLHKPLMWKLHLLIHHWRTRTTTCLMPIRTKSLLIPRTPVKCRSGNDCSSRSTNFYFFYILYRYRSISVIFTISPLMHINMYISYYLILLSFRIKFQIELFGPIKRNQNLCFNSPLQQIRSSGLHKSFMKHSCG